MNRPQTNTSQGHTDIELLGWWQNLPKAWHPYVYLARLDRPIGWWLLLLPAWWVIPLASADSGQMGWLMLLFMIGAITMRAAGCVINDMWDRDIDIKVERTQSRPLAAGTVSMG
ncbi:MAG: UbiA family prenyltransferase, partial [Candidatus Puniceispirillum sp.]